MGIATQAIARRDLAAAEMAIRRHLLADPTDARALELAGDIAAQRGDAKTSAEMYRGAMDHSTTPSQVLLDKLTQELVRGGNPFDAIEILQESIDRYPSRVETRYDLAGLATMLGLPEAAIPSLQWLAQHARGEPESLLVLADPSRVEPDAEICRKLLEQSPQDLRPEFCLAQLDAIKMNWQAVVQRLEPVLQRHKDFVPAQMLYGRGLIELNEFEKLASWQLELPNGVETSPQYWLIAASWRNSKDASKKPLAPTGKPFV